MIPFSPKQLSQCSRISVVALGLGLCSPAFALQPLEAFLRSARERSPDAREARATAEQQSAQAEVTLGRVLPSLAGRVAFTRNQYNSVIDLSSFGGAKPAPGSGPNVVTLQPYNQLDASATLTVPLLDLAGFERARAASTSADSAQASLASSGLQIEQNVTQAYYQLVANVALVDTAQRALEVSRLNLKLTRDRQSAGTVSMLDVERANAQVEQQVQQLASAELGVALAERNLGSTTGLVPEPAADGNLVQFTDDLHPEPGLETWEQAKDQLPAVTAATLSTRSAEQNATAARLALVPALGAVGTERWTNAAGFVGHASTYSAVVALTWGIDLTTFGNIRLQDAVAEVASAREQRIRLATADAIHRTWNQVQAALARSRSARVQSQASTHAAELARDRYQAGAATQLELLEAQRDSFSAQVAQIQADADLVNARAQLRLASGHSLLVN